MILYRTANGIFVEQNGKYFRVAETSLDTLISHENLQSYLESVIAGESPLEAIDHTQLEAPIEHQEGGASGVTYYRSRGARIEESKDAGGGRFL